MHGCVGKSREYDPPGTPRPPPPYLSWVPYAFIWGIQVEFVIVTTRHRRYEMYASTEAMCITFNEPDAFQVGSPGVVASHGPPHADGNITELKIAEV